MPPKDADPNYFSIPLPAGVRSDFVETYGWDALVRNLGGERKGMRDAWNAIEYAAPKGSSGTMFTLRFHHALLPLLISMIEVRWADQFSLQSELEPAYDRTVERLKALRPKGKKR